MAYTGQTDDFTKQMDVLGHSLSAWVKEFKHLTTYAVSQGGTSFIPDGWTKNGITKAEIVAAFNSFSAIVTLLEANGNAHWTNINKIISPAG